MGYNIIPVFTCVQIKEYIQSIGLNRKADPTQSSNATSSVKKNKSGAEERKFSDSQSRKSKKKNDNVQPKDKNKKNYELSSCGADVNEAEGKLQSLSLTIQSKLIVSPDAEEPWFDQV